MPQNKRHMAKLHPAYGTKTKTYAPQQTAYAVCFDDKVQSNTQTRNYVFGKVG